MKPIQVPTERASGGDPRLTGVALAMLAGLTLLAVGLWRIQIVNRDRYIDSLEAQSKLTIRVPGLRGRILDRNGVALADNQPSYKIHLYLEELRREFQDAYSRAKQGKRLNRPQRLALGREMRFQVVSNINHRVGIRIGRPLQLDAQQFHQHYERRLALPLILAENLTSQEVALYWERHEPIPGLDLDIQPERSYPHGWSACHVLGYIQRHYEPQSVEEETFHYRLPEYRGRLGIEGALDEVLRGQAGIKSILINSLRYRQEEIIRVPPQPGRNVILTLDSNIQREVEKILYSLTPLPKAAAVVLNPANGDVLAMVSTPPFRPGDYYQGMTQASYEVYADEHWKRMRNRAMQENYAPGSIFKIITALACLENGLDPQEPYENLGYYQLSPRSRPILDTAPPGTYDFARAFARSSNSYFIEHALRLGHEKLLEMAARCGLGQPTGLPTLQDHRGILPDPAQVRHTWTEGDTANLAIGQGPVAVTPVQMAIMTASVVNGGIIHWPRLVSRFEPQDASLSASTQVFPPARVRDRLHVSPANLALIQQAMILDVEDRNEGTGWRATVPGLRVGGKTGTAEVKRGGVVVRKITWFVSFGGREELPNPTHVVVVMVEDGASGGSTCAPLAGRIYQAIQKIEKQDWTDLSLGGDRHA